MYITAPQTRHPVLDVFVVVVVHRQLQIRIVGGEFCGPDQMPLLLTGSNRLDILLA
ncbi:hypothetical protein D3C71_1936240 [compost metagenome]